MKTSMNKFLYCLFSLLILMTIGCKEDKNVFPTDEDQEVVLPEGMAFDKYYPETAKTGDLITIEGKGFGIDASKVALELNYRPAEIQEISDTKITFLVPENTTTKGHLRIMMVDKKVDYKFQTEFLLKLFSKHIQVSTVGGWMNLNINWWDEARDAFMLYDGRTFFINAPFVKSIRLEDETISYNEASTYQYDRIRNIAFSLDKSIIYQCRSVEGRSTDQPSIVVFKKEENFGIEHPYLTGFSGLQSMAMNPIDGEVFFYERIWSDVGNNTIYRLDHDNRKGIAVLDKPAPLYGNQAYGHGTDYINWPIDIRFSSDGSKLYMMVHQSGDASLRPSAIWVVDYDFATKRLKEDTQRLLCGNMGESGYADGSLSSAQFSYPIDLVTDKAGNIYVADRDNHCIRKIATDGTVSTYAGIGGTSGYEDGTSREAMFYTPTALVLEEKEGGSMILYVLDSGNGRLRKIEEIEEEITE